MAKNRIEETKDPKTVRVIYCLTCQRTLFEDTGTKEEVPLIAAMVRSHLEHPRGSLTDTIEHEIITGELGTRLFFKGVVTSRDTNSWEQ